MSTYSNNSMENVIDDHPASAWFSIEFNSCFNNNLISLEISLKAVKSKCWIIQTWAILKWIDLANQIPSFFSQKSQFFGKILVF